MQLNYIKSSSPLLLLLIVVVSILSIISQCHQVNALSIINKSTSSGDNDLQFPIYPFTRPLTLNDTGSDVYKLQLLLYRYPTCEKLYPTITTSSVLNIPSFMSGTFDMRTMNCLIQFINEYSLYSNIYNSKSPYISLTPNIANKLITKYMNNDKYIDTYVYSNGTFINGKQLPNPYKYYVHVPVYSNRSIELICTLYDKYGKLKHSFKCRTHGQPKFNQLTSDGDTPTGLYSFDLNTPEDNPVEYGPYDVNRAVYGLKGNAELIYPKYRSGILLHTGEWNIVNNQMPNSHGCIHAMPNDIKLIAEILKNELGVIANQNLFGKYPYPYTPQGLLSVVLIK